MALLSISSVHCGSYIGQWNAKLSKSYTHEFWCTWLVGRHQHQATTNKFMPRHMRFMQAMSSNNKWHSHGDISRWPPASVVACVHFSVMLIAYWSISLRLCTSLSQCEHGLRASPLACKQWLVIDCMERSICWRLLWPPSIVHIDSPIDDKCVFLESFVSCI